MSEPKSRGHFYDGAFYGIVFERMLRGVHLFVARHVPGGGRVLDACCGTGGLGVILSESCREVVGVDLSRSNIRFADRRLQRLGIRNLRYEIGDVSQLSYPNGCFDTACVTMALHEMPESARLPVLSELARVAREILLVDFCIPMPLNFAGWRNRTIELLAGRDHYRNFCDYSRRGGLGRLVEEADLEIAFERPFDSGTLILIRLHSLGSRE